MNGRKARGLRRVIDAVRNNEQLIVDYNGVHFTAPLLRGGAVKMMASPGIALHFLKKDFKAMIKSSFFKEKAHVIVSNMADTSIWGNPYLRKNLEGQAEMLLMASKTFHVNTKLSKRALNGESTGE